MPTPDRIPEPNALHALPYRRPWLVVLVAALLAAFGGYVYCFHLEIQSGRAQLSNLDSPLNQRFESYRQDFAVEDSLVLVISSGPRRSGSPDLPPGLEVRARMKQVAREWAEQIRTRPELFPDVIERVSSEDMGPLALLYLPNEAFDAAVIAIDSGLPMLESWAEAPTLQRMFELITDQLGQLGAATEEMPAALLASVLAQAEQFFRWFGGELGTDQNQAELAAMLSASLGVGEFDANGYLFVDGGRILLVPASLRGDPNQPNEYARAVEFAWDALDQAIANQAEGGAIAAGLAGLPALDYEELVTSQGEFARGAVLSLVLVILLFMWAFHTLKRPALAALCLCMSIGMTFVYTWLVVGHLNLVAMVFAIILVVLGIDFAIHFTTHYERALGRASDPARAGSETLRRIGGALWMGGLTTVAAFLAAGFTEAPGLSELGIIAGGGLLICLVVMILVYPAMLYLVDRRSFVSGAVRGPGAVGAVVLAGRPSIFMRVACLASLALAALGFAGGQYRFDTNLLALQPTDGRAAHWQNILLAADDSTQFAIATFADRESLQRVRRRFDAMPSLVRSTQCVFPQDEIRKRGALAALATRLAVVDFGDAAMPDRHGLMRALFGLRNSVRRLAGSSEAAARALAGVSGEVDHAYRRLRELPAERAEQRLGRIQTDIVSAAHLAHEEIGSLCSPPPFDIDLSPRLLRRRFVGRSGRLALQIYPEQDTWDKDGLDRFVTAAAAIEPGLFGGVVTFRDNAQVMVESFFLASIYSLAAVLLLVLVWSRSLRDTALALFPLLTSVGLLLGIMRLSPWALPWNFANCFALPILIGVGVDSGIHLLRAYRDDAVAFHGARRAVLVSTLTTLIGFGILSSSQHLGVRSLGTILTIGISLVLVTSLLLMPVVLQMFSRPPGRSEA